MKKRYGVLLCIALLSCLGCADIRREAELVQAEHEAKVKSVKNGEGYNLTSKVERIEFEGHTYIVFREGVPHGVGVSAVHDPDCECKSR